jgi:hypothetical protein
LFFLQESVAALGAIARGFPDERLEQPHVLTRFGMPEDT